MSHEKYLDKGDPKKLFRLVDRIATGSYGQVFKVRTNHLTLWTTRKFIAGPEQENKRNSGVESHSFGRGKENYDIKLSAALSSAFSSS
jgi:hypothetical protein